MLQGAGIITVKELHDCLKECKSSPKSAKFFQIQPEPELNALYELLNGKSDNDTITDKQIYEKIRDCSGIKAKSHRAELLYNPDKNADDTTDVSNVIRTIGKKLSESVAVEQELSPRPSP